MIDKIDGSEVTVLAVARMSNCRLRKVYTRLQQLIVCVELEIERRLGQGGGGLK